MSKQPTCTNCGRSADYYGRVEQDCIPGRQHNLMKAAWSAPSGGDIPDSTFDPEPYLALARKSRETPTA